MKGTQSHKGVGTREATRRERGRTVSLSPKAFFSTQQMRDIEEAMLLLEGVGINIKVFRELEGKGSRGSKEDTNQYRHFMGLARLWRVVREILTIAGYVDKMLKGDLTIKDRWGNEYGLTLVRSHGKEWEPPPDLINLPDFEEEDLDTDR